MIGTKLYPAINNAADKVNNGLNKLPGLVKGAVKKVAQNNRDQTKKNGESL